MGGRSRSFGLSLQKGGNRWSHVSIIWGIFLSKTCFSSFRKNQRARPCIVVLSMPLRHACESSTTIVTMDWFVDAVLILRQNAARIDMKIEGRYRFAQGWGTFLRPTHLLETSLLTVQLIALILLHVECRSYSICQTNCKIWPNVRVYVNKSVGQRRHKQQYIW